MKIRNMIVLAGMLLLAALLISCEAITPADDPRTLQTATAHELRKLKLEVSQMSIANDRVTITSSKSMDDPYFSAVEIDGKSVRLNGISRTVTIRCTTEDKGVGARTDEGRSMRVIIRGLQGTPRKEFDDKEVCYPFVTPANMVTVTYIDRVEGKFVEGNNAKIEIEFGDGGLEVKLHVFMWDSEGYAKYCPINTISPGKCDVDIREIPGNQGSTRKLEVMILDEHYRIVVIPPCQLDQLESCYVASPIKDNGN